MPDSFSDDPSSSELVTGNDCAPGRSTNRECESMSHFRNKGERWTFSSMENEDDQRDKQDRCRYDYDDIED